MAWSIIALVTGLVLIGIMRSEISIPVCKALRCPFTSRANWHSPAIRPLVRHFLLQMIHPFWRLTVETDRVSLSMSWAVLTNCAVIINRFLDPRDIASALDPEPGQIRPERSARTLDTHGSRISIYIQPYATDGHYTRNLLYRTQYRLIEVEELSEFFRRDAT